MSEKVRRLWFWLPLLLGAGLFFTWAWWSQSFAAGLGPIVAVDINQHRADTALPAPQAGLQIRQSFYPRWDGLCEIELLLARAGEPDAEESGYLRLQLRDEAGDFVAEQVVESRFLSHDALHTFRFTPQAHSAGRRYTLYVGGSADVLVSVQGYSLDAYEQGRLTLARGALAQEDMPPTPAQDLRFVTRYQLTWTDAAIALGTIFYREGLFLFLALAFIPMPGCLLLLAGQGHWPRWDAAAWWGTAFALGTAVWPLLWSGLTLAGGRWESWLLWLLLVSGWAATLYLWWRQRTRQVQDEAIPSHSLTVSTLRGSHLLLLLLLGVALAVRLLAVRDVAAPPWVDSSRHALITAVMAAQGQAPSDYEPFLPVERFPYHFGFHTLSASLHLMTGWPLPRLLLTLGQLLNSLAPLTIYAAAWFLTRRPGVGLLAAFLVALPFFFPGYYATWGRLTQLTAVFLLPILLALTWLLVRGGRRWRATWWLVGLLAAGLFFIHFRVLLFYLPFAALVWLVSFGRNGRWLALAAALAAILTLPRALELAQVTEPVSVVRFSIAGYNEFPVSYLMAGWERHFAWLAAAGLALALAPALWPPRQSHGQGSRWSRQQWRWRRRTLPPLILAAWVAGLFLLLSGERLGLPETTLVNMNSMYITLFVPLALFLAIVAGQLLRWLRGMHRLLPAPAYLIAGGALAAALLFGLRQQVTILNPQTILMQAADLEGLAWVAENLPEDVTVAVNSWRWLGNTWAGHDGGAWLLPLTGRATTTPPIDYIYHRDLFESVIAFNEEATAVPDWSTVEAAAWLRQQEVSHVFVGGRGGFFDAAALARNPGLEMVYGRNGVFIFALEP